MRVLPLHSSMIYLWSVFSQGMLASSQAPITSTNISVNLCCPNMNPDGSLIGDSASACRNSSSVTGLHWCLTPTTPRNTTAEVVVIASKSIFDRTSGIDNQRSSGWTFRSSSHAGISPSLLGLRRLNSRPSSNLSGHVSWGNWRCHASVTRLNSRE